jgi:hypothetical protein
MILCVSCSISLCVCVHEQLQNYVREQLLCMSVRVRVRVREQLHDYVRELQHECVHVRE